MFDDAPPPPADAPPEEKRPRADGQRRPPPEGDESTGEAGSAQEFLSLPKAVAALFADLPGLLSDRVHLLALELRRASSALGQMVALGLLAAILFATAWVALWGALVAGSIALGLAWPWAALMVLLVNLVAAVWCVMRVKALAPLLALPATLRRLTDSDSRERQERRDDDEHDPAPQSAP